MNLSCIVVSYQVRDLLSECLLSLAEVDEVLVVDNGYDGSAQMVRERFPEVRVFEQPHNPGFGAAVNLAASHATGDAFLLLNPDAAIRPGQVGEMKSRLVAKPAAYGFRQVDERGEFQLAYGGAPSFGSELGRWAAQKAVDYRFGPGRAWVDSVTRHPKDVPWVAASCLLVSREAFEDVGGFDEDFFLYFEDIDFCLRLGERGHSVVYDPTLTVLHRRGQSAARSEGPSRRAYRRSQIRFWRKHRGPLYASFIELYQRLRGVGPD
ncbi:MAG: glycosyltransferase family 2 protein [Myxococcota bacterium]